MFKKILLVLIAALFLLPTFAQADGGLFPPDNQWMYETGQKGAIFYQNETETLVLQTSFSGDAKDFAWIIPTPSQPEVTKVSDDIFTKLTELTSVNDIIIPMLGGIATTSLENADKVQVLEEKQLGIYEVKVLSATSANALYDWLKENNYKYPESKKYILDDYITNKWFFTTAKISTSAITEDVATKLKQGKLSPIKLVFETKNMVYPLKISAVTETGHLQSFDDYYTGSYNQSIELYIFADHKKEISGFSVDYANWIKPKEIEKLAKDDSGNFWVTANKKMYLTKLSQYLPVIDMTNDLFPDNAQNNQKVGVQTIWQKTGELGNYAWFFWLAVIILVTSVILSFASNVNKIQNKYAKILPVIFIIGTIFVLLVYYLCDYFGYGYMPHYSNYNIAYVSEITLVIVLLILLIKKKY